MKRAVRTLLVSAMLGFLLPFITPALSYSTQALRMQGIARTVAPAVSKISPARVRAIHKATPKSLLVVKKIYIVPGSPRLGDTVAIHAQVVNNGPKTVKNVKVNFYLGRALVAWQVYDIKSKGTHTFQGVFTQKQAPQTGRYTVSARVDPKQTLERRFYRCNSATLKITIAAPVVRKPKRTVSPEKLTSKGKSRHAFIRPGQAVNKGTRSGTVSMRTSQKSSQHALRRIPPGKILNVAVKVQDHTGSIMAKTRQQKISHSLVIRWTHKGLMPTQVDLKIYPVHQVYKGITLKRYALNNGYVRTTASGLNEKQKYIVRVQTHNGKIYGDSKAFYLSPPVVIMPQKVGYAKTPARTGRTAKIMTHKTADHIKFGPSTGPGSARPLAVSAKAAGVKKVMPGGPMTTYGPNPVLIVTSPSSKDTWETSHSYTITWLFKNSQKLLPVTKITLKDTSGVVRDTIFSSTTAPIKTNSVDYTVPSTLTAGNYYIHLTAGAVTGKSATFHIGLFLVLKGKKNKVETAKDLLPKPNSVSAGMLMDTPQITYFNYTYSSDDPNNYILRLQFYWKDKNQDLFGGNWTFGYKHGKWYKKLGTIAKLPYSDDFRDTKGMYTFEIPLDKKSWKDKTVPVAFYLTDAKGLTSNVVKGTVTFTDGLHAPTPVKIAAPDPITFVSPHSYSNSYLSGETVDIRLALNTNLRAQNPPIKIELLLAEKKGAKAVIIYNKPLPKDGHITWKIPQSIAEGLYYFRASSSTPNASAKSTPFAIQNKGITVTSPKRGSLFQVGDTIVFQWKAIGLSQTKMDIYIVPVGAQGGPKLTKSPLLIKNGTWSWTIKPGTVPTGKCALWFTQHQPFALLATTPITITYPKNIAPPSLVFTKPSAGQTTRWVAGTSQSIEWGLSGEFTEPDKAFVSLRKTDDPYKSYKIGEIKIPVHSGKLTGSTQVYIPANVPSGPYRIEAVGSIMMKLGESSAAIEIVSSDVDMLPATGIQFKITGVDYPIAGGPMTVHVEVNTPKPFRVLSNGNQSWGTQYLAYRITNYAAYGPQMGNAANDNISVVKNPLLFPKYVFPSGKSNYIIKFTPKLEKKLSLVKIHQDKPWPSGECITNYYPKLELKLVTFTIGGNAVDAYLTTHIRNTNGKVIDSLIGGTNNICLGENLW